MQDWVEAVGQDGFIIRQQITPESRLKKTQNIETSYPKTSIQMQVMVWSLFSWPDLPAYQ